MPALVGQVGEDQVNETKQNWMQGWHYGKGLI